MALTGDQLHQRFKRGLGALAVMVVAFLASAEWMRTISRQDLSKEEPWRMLLVSAGLSAVTFLGMLVLIVLLMRVGLKARKDPVTKAAFNDEFHRETERKSAVVAWVSTLVALAILGVLTSTTSLLDGTRAVMVAIAASMVSGIGSYLYFERGQ